MAYSKYREQIDTPENIITSQTNIVVNWLVDRLFEEESGFNIDQLILDLLKLTDNYGDAIFGVGDDLHFDKASTDVLLRAIKSFENSFEEDEDFFDVDSEDVYCTLRKLEHIREYDIKTKNEQVVTFVTIPTEDGSSVLDYDIAGSPVTITLNGKDFKLNAPHKYEFFLDQPSLIKGKTNAEVILSELEKIEGTLSFDPCIVKNTGQHRPFQSEGSTQVKRNTSACVRIQINQYGESVVAVIGIFHKEGQVDQTVQEEYNNRQEVLGEMKLDDRITLQAAKDAYYEFKMKLIKAVYGSKLDNVQAVHRYMMAMVNRAPSFI